MLPTFARLGLRSAAPQRFTAVSKQQTQKVLSRRAYTTDREGTRGDSKAKLVFRFGLKDVPVELYPMFVIVIAACAGGAFAIGRHMYHDNLRLVPSSMRTKEPETQH